MALIKRTVLPGRAYAASHADSPRSGTLAVAVRFPDGWTVARGRGRVVGKGLTQRQAVALMLRTARSIVDRTAARRAADTAGPLLPTPALTCDPTGEVYGLPAGQERC